MDNQTIYAPATPNDTGGICVLRISGDKAFTILKTVFSSKKAVSCPRMLCYGNVMDADEILDECMAVYLPAPHTYTREDVVELHLHASKAVTKAVYALLDDNGARMATPGEFTKRAFINGRIDLSQAEAVMELLDSATKTASKQALLRLQGCLHDKMMAFENDILDLLSEIALCVDYPEHDIEEITLEKVSYRCKSLIDDMNGMIKQSESGRMIASGVNTVICGRPNVGKSTLFNALLGEDVAIVTHHEGTTRDSINVSANINDIQFNFIDTAGLRDSNDQVEVLGIERTKKAMESADLTLLVLDFPLCDDDFTLLDYTSDKRRVIVINKADLENIDISALKDHAKDVVLISAKTLFGMDELKEKLCDLVVPDGEFENSAPISNHRQLAALKRSRDNLMAAKAAADDYIPPDLVAIDLTEALYAVGEVMGKLVDDEMINRVFERFCIGK